MYKILAALILAPTFATAADTVPVTVTDITALPVDALDWATTPEGVAFAPINGDRFIQEYMAMVALPHGLISPAHTKSADMFGIVISGAMTHVPADADPTKGALLTAGAYYHIPAGLPHVSSCLSAEDCVAFLYQPGPFDFLPVTP